MPNQHVKKRALALALMVLLAVTLTASCKAAEESNDAPWAPATTATDTATNVTDATTSGAATTTSGTVPDRGLATVYEEPG